MDEKGRYEHLYGTLVVDGVVPHAGTLLAYAANRYAHRCALRTNDMHITYAQLYGRALSVSRFLHARGVTERDRVCMWFENTPEFYSAYYGIWQLGAVVTPLNTFLQDAEIAHIIGDAQPKLIVTTRAHVARFASVSVPVLAYEDIDFSLTGALPAITMHADEMSVLLYTSGTTGFPKGVMLSSRAVITSVLQGVCVLELAQDERVFAILPLFHSFAQNTCVWASIYAGATIILVHKIDRHSLLQGLTLEPTIFLGIPALYGLLCLLRRAPLDSVRYFICGGDALPDKIRTAFALIYGRKVCNGYGLTEAGPTVSVHCVDEFVAGTCVGKPLYGISVSIRSDQGVEQRPGTVGQLWIQAPNLMLGYYKASDLTAHTIVDGWLDTGDLARIDERGYIEIVGRHKDLIIHKGINIYPAEIENVLLNVPGVTGAAVVGQADEATGQVPVAFILGNASEDELRLHCMRCVAAYKVPRRFILLESFPLTSLGKVDKKKLAARYLV